MNKALHRMGEYTLLMMKSITLPDRWSMFFKQLIKEIYKLGVDSLWIVIIISVFIGTGYRHPDLLEYQFPLDS